MNFRPLLAIGASFLTATFAHAAPVEYDLDPARSTVTLSGTVSGAQMTQQGPGSLTTRIDGIVRANTTATTIQFTGGSLLDALTNGVWQPAPGGGTGSAAADFGAQANAGFVTVRGALRNVILDVTNAAPVALNNGTFSAESLVFSFPTNSSSTIDFTAGFLGSGSRSLAGNSTNRTATVGTLANTAQGETLTINVDATFFLSLVQDNDTTLRIQGSLVGVRRSAPQINASFGPNNTLVFRVSAANNTAKLQRSTNLRDWTDVTVTPTVEGDSKIYRVPAAGAFEFFRIVQTGQ
jgi:hypothetical protein